MMTTNATTPLPPPQTTPRWVKIILALSLTLNLVVLALVLGAVSRGGPMSRMDRIAADGFGAYAQALDHADRRALFKDMRGAPGMDRAERDRHMAAVAAALAAVPFSPEDLKSAMAAQEAGMQRRITQAHAVLYGYLAGLKPERRQAIAERLLQRGPPKP